MSNSQLTIESVVEKMSVAGDVRPKKMFGSYGIFLDGKMFAIFDDDTVFIKITTAAQELYPEAAKASPYPGAKPCLVIPLERLDHQEWLSELITETVKLLPAPKSKSKTS